jgi:hypothetical protein
MMLLLLACAGEDPTDTQGTTGDTATDPTPTDSTPTDTEPTGACGPPIDFDLTLVGTVVGPYGTAAPDTEVWVEDRGWSPGRILGTGTTDAYGAFTLSLTDVTSVEGCWATLLDYVLVGERTMPAGVQSGELDLNSSLYNAIEDGSLVADLGSFPLTLVAE